MRTGRIYTIRSFQTDKYYIGSTFQTLSKRIGDHRTQYKKFLSGCRGNNTSYKILKHEDHYIELLETLECKTKEELIKREGELQRTHKDNIVNCRIENRTRKQYRIDNKERYKQYRDQHKEQMKQYNIINKEKIKIRTRQYYIANKEKINLRNKINRNDNKENLKEKHNCICGSIYRKANRIRHEKTKKHQKYITVNNL